MCRTHLLCYCARLVRREARVYVNVCERGAVRGMGGKWVLNYYLRVRKWSSRMGRACACALRKSYSKQFLLVAAIVEGEGVEVAVTVWLRV